MEDSVLQLGDLNIQNLGKCYRIYDRPQDRLREALSLRGKKRHREFWALRGLDLTIRRGETWGIIGRNGSGKSTLLQMICGTVTPTEGTIERQGRIAALLELGSGFNPEFTGSENIAINGSLLGLTDQEIAARRDDIIAFADIGEFIEQPVKKYSSGMFVRLAFAIAIHASPDILIVDEALSVGDVAFQNKCVARIRELRESGLTLVFVSHDLSRLQLLCDQAAWIHQGRLRAIGDPIQICQDYCADTTGGRLVSEGDETPKIVTQDDTGMAFFETLDFDEPLRKGDRLLLGTGQSLRIGFVLKALVDLEPMVIAISIYATDGTWLIGQTSLDESVFWPGIQSGETCGGQIAFSEIYLAPGDYKLCLGAYNRDLTLLHALSNLNLSFSVRSDRPSWGLIHHPCHWIVR